MSRNTDGIFDEVWADSGDTAEPPFDRDEGWPIEYSQAGGSAPARTTFNLLFKELYALGVDVNKFGCSMPWNALVSYDDDAIVMGSDGDLYRSVTASNLNNDPTTDDGSNWEGYSKPSPTRATLSSNTTFTYNNKEKLVLILDPNAADRNVNPSGAFPDGFEVVVINIGSAYNLVFDSTGLAESVTPGDRQSFYYLETEDEWR